MGWGAGDGWACAVDARRPPGSVTAGEWFRPAGGAGRNQDAALSPLSAVTNVPLMLARLIARSVVALGDGLAVSRASVGI